MLSKLIISLVAVLGTSSVSVGAMDVTTWKTLSETNRFYYVNGIFEGWLGINNLAQFGKDKYQQEPSISDNMYHSLITCAIDKGMKYGQFVAIVEKYVNNNPEKWHEPMESSVYFALHEVCTTH